VASAVAKPVPPANTNTNGLQSSVQVKKEAQNTRKIVWGCFGGAVLVFIVFLIIVFIFVGGPADSPNPLAKLLGIDQNQFVNGLITTTNLIFILVALVTVITALVGFFKMSTAKKDDKITKRKGATTTILGIVFFILSILIWAGVYLYLDSKRTAVAESKALPAISTQPVETLNLTAPVTIKFDASNAPIDTRKYEIISYAWDFSNGDTQTGQIVNYEFKDKGKKDGRFDVLLTITKRDIKTGEEIEDQFSKVISIANIMALADIKASAEKGSIPLTVQFDASASTDDDGTISSYEWDLDGDGLYDDASGEKIEHVFEKIGKYNVGLQITDNNGQHTESSIVIEAEAPQEAEAVVSVSTQGNLQTNVSYVFDAKNSKSPSGQIIKYSWNFGDGTKVETTRTTSHTFTKSGTYEVDLTVTDDTGLSDTTTKKIVVVPYVSDVSAYISTEPALATGSTTLSGQVPFKVSFGAEKSQYSPDLIEYEWDFDGDGTADSFEQGGQYTFNEVGSLHS
jgi:PKD repeat protein